MRRILQGHWMKVAKEMLVGGYGCSSESQHSSGTNTLAEYLDSNTLDLQC